MQDFFHKNGTNISFSENDNFLGLISLFLPGKIQKSTKKYPQISKKQFSIIQQKLLAGASPAECFCIFQDNFKYDEDEIKNIQFGQKIDNFELKTIIISNLLGWLNHSKCQTSESFSLLATEIINAWKFNYERIFLDAWYFLYQYVSLFPVFLIPFDFLQESLQNAEFINNPNYLLKFLEIFLKISLKNKATFIYRSISVLFQEIFEKYQSVIFNYDFQNLIAITSSYFPNFDPNISMILSLIADLKPSPYIDYTFRHIAQNVANQIRYLHNKYDTHNLLSSK